MADLDPVMTRLSQLLVAWTIELDNEFEHRMPHRTAADRGKGGGRGPWLVSWAMWANLLRLVPAEGVALGDLAGPRGAARLSGPQRWGWVVLEPEPDRPAADKAWRVWPTRACLRAGDIWRVLPDEVEQRWRTRLGPAVVDELRCALTELGDRLDPGLPRYVPIAGYGLFANSRTPAPGPPDDVPDLSALLARPLTAYALEFEDGSAISLAAWANVLRLVDARGRRVGELPAAGGVSPEAVAMAISFLESGGWVEQVPDPTSRGKLVRLTSKGSTAHRQCADRAAELAQAWQQRYGLDRLAAAAAAVDGQALAAGLHPYEDGWRAGRHYRWQTAAILRDPYAALPHHPMVLHRGGYPDGS